jgi:hypothetical protein
MTRAKRSQQLYLENGAGSFAENGFIFFLEILICVNCLGFVRVEYRQPHENAMT